MLDPTEEIIEIEYDSDGDELIEIEEYVYETDSDDSYYEEEEIIDLPAVIEEDEEEESSDEEEPVGDSDSGSRHISRNRSFSRSFNSSYSSPLLPYQDEDVVDAITNDDEDEDVDNNDKPAWAKVTLKKTTMGKMLKKEGNLAAAITFTPFKNNNFNNDVCNQNVLKKTATGERVLNGEYISAPITHIPKDTKFKNKVVDPKKLKHTEKGEHLKKGEYLSAPITHIPKKTEAANPVARPEILRHTEEGEAVKQGASLSAPITHIRDMKKKKSSTRKKKLVTRKVKKKSLDQDGESTLKQVGEVLSKETASEPPVAAAMAVVEASC